MKSLVCRQTIDSEGERLRIEEATAATIQAFLYFTTEDMDVKVYGIFQLVGNLQLLTIIPKI